MSNAWGPGRVIAGRYRLAAQLGQGGMGSVWRADHLTLRSPVAVKLIDPEIANRAEILDRFQREAQAAATLRSPHVVQILDYGVDEGVPYIVMELLEGESLASRLERVGRLSYGETARFVMHVARALGRAHEAGIVHRDLKPDNVFLVRNDDQEVGKVLDFGIAKQGGLGTAKGPTRTGNILGTPGYMSPEQAQGTKAVDGRSDLWSLGVIAYECIVGQVPFESPALGDLLLKICVHPIPIPSQHGVVPAGFDAWFARACCRDVDQRFQSAKDLADALRAVLVPELASERSAVFSLQNGPDTVPAATPIFSSGAHAPSPAAGAPTLIAGSATPDAQATIASPGHAHGGTVPGLTMPLGVPPKRSVAPLVAALVVGTLAVGGVATWVVMGRNQKPSPAMVTLSPVPTATATAEATTAPAGAAAPASTAAAPSVVPSGTVAPAETASSHAATAAPSAKPHAGGGHAVAPPAHTAQGAAGPKDNRLGF